MGRNYRLFVAGQLVSLVGTWTQTVAQDWLVYRLTGSAFWLGVVSLCQQLPIFLLATAGGLVADRYSRRGVLIATQSVSMLLAFVLAALTITGSVRIAHVLVLGALLGITKAIDTPTRQAFVTGLVAKDQLPRAVAINSSMVTGAAFVGPAIAGVAIEAVGEGWCFMINGASFVAVIAGLALMRDLPSGAARPREGVRARVAAGFRFVAQEPDVRAVMLLLAFTAFVGLPAGTLLPVLAGQARTLGFYSAATGGGALVSGLAIAARGLSHRWIAAACFALGVFTALLGTQAPTIGVLVCLGAATMTQVTLINARIQTLTPDALRGRVMAIWAMIFMGGMPFGSIAVGALAARFGPKWPLVGEGILCVLGALVFSARARTGRE